MPTSLTNQMFASDELSLADQMFANQEQKSLTDQMFEEEVPDISGIAEDLAFEELRETEVATPLKESIGSETIQSRAMTSLFPSVHEDPFGQDDSFVNKTIRDATKNALLEGAKDVGMEAVAVTELAMSVASGMLLYLPSKLYGVAALPFGRKVANIAEEEIAKLGYQPFTDKGKEAAELVGKGFELFLTPARVIGEYVSKLSPEAGYLVEFGFELAEFALTGGAVKGAKAKFKPGVEQGTKLLEAKRDLELDTIREKQETVEGIPNEIIRNVQRDVLEVEKIQTELKHQEMMDKLDYVEMIREDLRSQAKQIKQVKQPQRDIVDVQVDKALEKLPEAINRGVKETKEPVRLQYEKAEPITDIDLQTGTREPVEFSTDKHPLREHDPVKTEAMDKVYKEQVKGVMSDPELMTGKLVNDVNLFLDGKEISIEDVRNTLSNLAARADEAKDYFREGSGYPSTFINWKEYVEQAAIWARKAEPKDLTSRIISETIAGIKDPLETPHDARNLFVLETRRRAQLTDELTQDLFLRPEYVDHFMPKIDKSWEKGASKKDIIKMADKFADTVVKRLYPDRLKIEPSEPSIELHSGVPVGKAVDLLKDTARKFKNRIIESVNPSQKQLLRDITALHTDSKIDADMTYSTGQMWKGTGLEPRLKFDKRIEAKGVIKADITKGLPAEDNSISSIMFDPPFLVKAKPEQAGKIGKRFTVFKSVDELWSFYKKGVDEAFRVLKPGGKLITKTQDLTTGKGIFASSSEIYNFAIQTGFRSIDRFIHQREIVGPLAPNIKVQRHARKTHSDFWVFEKPKRPYKYPGEGGVTLRSGLPIDEVAKQLIAGARRYKKAFIKDVDTVKKVRKPTFKKGKKATAEALWDTMTTARKALLGGQKKGELGPEAYKSLQKMVNVAGGHGWGQTLFNQFSKEVYGGYTTEQVAILNRLIRGGRIQDISKYKTTKFPKDQGPAEATAYENLFEFVEENITPELKSKLLRSKDAYFEWMNRIVDYRFEEGIINKELAEGLKKHDYAKFKGIGQRIEDGKGGLVEYLYDANDTIKTRGGKVKSVKSSGILTLQKGKATDILHPDQKLTALEIFNRTYGQGFRNRVFQSLAELARKNPVNSIVRLAKKDAHPDQPSVGDSRTWTRYTFREDGKRKSIFIDTEFAKGLESAGQDVSPRAINWSKNFALAPIAQAMLTGAAPLWSLFVNLPRDILHTYISAGEYKGGKFKQVFSSNPVIFGGQMAAGYKRTFYDTFFRSYKQKERTKFMRPAERGLLMPFLATQASLSASGFKLPKKFAAVEKFMLQFPTSLELWTRHNIADRVVRRRASEKGITPEEAWKNNEIVDEAVFVARDYLDFSQGGWWIKMLNQTGKIYLNAGAQAGRTFMRALKENLPQAILRVTQTIGIPTVMTVAASKLYAPKTSSDIPKYQDDVNLNIPFPDSMRFTDSTGQEVGLYLSIPLDSGASFLKNLFMGLTEKFMYDSGLSKEEPNYESIIGALTKFAPDIMSLPPSSRAAFEYMFNIDFWTRKRISPEAFSYPKSAEEFTKGETPEAAIDIGKITDLSPDRLVRVKRAILGNNIWSYAIGKGYDEIFGDVPKEMQEEHLALVLARIPGIKRFIKIARPGTGIMDKQTKIVEESRFENFVNSRNIDFYTKASSWHGSKEAKTDLMDYLNDKSKVKDLDEYKRLKDRITFLRKIKGLQNRRSWARMWYESSEDKAEDYINRLSLAETEKDKSELKRQMSVITAAGGYVTPEFRLEVSKLRNQ